MPACARRWLLAPVPVAQVPFTAGRGPWPDRERRASRALLGSALLWLLPLVGCSEEDRQQAGREHNVVLVTLDTTRADFFSSYGYPRETTPHFDALAADGALFEQCISVAAVTPVSHASILTGLYPHQHGLRVMFAEGGFRISDHVETLPERLQRAGYRTGAFLSSYPVTEVFGFDRGFETFDWPALPPAEQRVEKGEFAGWDNKQQRRSDTTTERALAWLADEERGDAPFLMWIHYWDPHGGTEQPARDLLEEFVPEFLAPDFDPKTGVSNDQLRRYYAAQIKMVDRQFGKLMAALDEQGLADDTIVVVVSDHGEGLGDHDWHAHRVLYQEQIRLPLLVRAPGVPAGRRIAPLVRSIDIVPTVLELLDLAAPPMEGKSLVGLMQGRAEERGRSAYAEQLNQLDANASMLKRRPNDDFVHVLMDRDWKLIYRPTNPGLSELYDLAADPRELRNLWGRGAAAQAVLVRDLEALSAFRTEPFPPSEDGSAPDVAALRELGYLGGAEDESE